MNEFDDTGQSKGSPKLGSNLARQLVPVEPTPAMLDAMQAAGLAAFDADVAASLGDTPLDPTHARRAVWRAALHAAPEAPSAEPCPYVRNSGSTHWCALAEQSADHTAAMRQALACLQRAVWELRGVTPTQDMQESIDALRAALGEKE